MLNRQNYRYADAFGAGALIFASSMIQDHGWQDFLHDPWYPFTYGAWFLIALFFSLRRAGREAKEGHPPRPLTRVLAYYAAALLVFLALPGTAGRLVLAALSLGNFFNPTVPLPQRA